MDITPVFHIPSCVFIGRNIFDQAKKDRDKCHQYENKDRFEESLREREALSLNSGLEALGRLSAPISEICVRKRG